MPTGNAAVTRNAETWSYSLLAVPQAMSLYLKFKEMGTNMGSGVTRLLRIGGSGTPNLFVTYSNGYGTRFVTSAGSAASSSLNPTTVVGNIVELLITVAANGQVTPMQTINGGAAVSASASAAKPLPQAWAAQTFEVVAAPTGVGPADIGVIACAGMRGVQSLDTMRRFAGTHTRNG